MSLAFIMAIRDALGVAAAQRDLLTPLARVFGATDSASREAAVIDLVETLNAGVVPGELADANCAGSTVLNPFRYERSAGWRWGTHRTRRQLVEALWGRSSSSPSSPSSQDGPASARAAFLLAVEDGFPYGFGTMLYLLGEATFGLATGWNARQIASVRSLLDEERRRTFLFATEARRAAEAIVRMIERAEGMDVADVLLFFSATEKMSQLSRGRPDVQMRLANYAWRAWNLARGRGRLDVLDQLRSAAVRWSGAADEPHSKRWLQEALNAPAREIRTAGTRRADANEILR
jgi:hypothetical protein